MNIKRNKVLYDASTAGNGDWIRLDSRYEKDSSRVLQIEVTSGDTISIEGTTRDERGSTPAIVIASLTAEDITEIASYTASDIVTLYGPYTYIRAVKTGTTGNAKVQGFV